MHKRRYGIFWSACDYLREYGTYFNDEIANWSMRDTKPSTERRKSQHVYRRPRQRSLVRNYKSQTTSAFLSHGGKSTPHADKRRRLAGKNSGQCINIFCDYETGEHQW